MLSCVAVRKVVCCTVSRGSKEGSALCSVDPLFMLFPSVFNGRLQSLIKEKQKLVTYKN